MMCTIRRLFLLNAFLSLFSLSTAAEKPVQVQWDPPTPEEAELISGYNIYEITITPPIRPAKYDINIVSPLPAIHLVSYTKINTTLIPAGTFTFTIHRARPGMQTVVRAYSAIWDTESPDSDILTFPLLPPKQKGLKNIR